MDDNQTVVAHYSSVPIALLVDNNFDDSADSTSLRTNSPGQDWYESYGESPTKLTLDSSNIGGNSGNKAALKYSDPTGIGFAYLTQEFGSPQSGPFTVSFDIFIDRIQDNGDRDRTSLIYIGNDSGGTDGPNATDNERFLFLTFYDPNPTSIENDMEIRVREFRHDHPTNPQLWHITSTWTPIASGLSYDTWYKISVAVNVMGGTYDVYLDDVLVGDDISKYEDYPSSSLSHISFSTGTAAQGDFYVDNVEEIDDFVIEIDANFDSGSIGPFSLSGNEINLSLRTDVVGYQYWTYFSASNVLDQEVTVNISGIDSIPLLAEQIEENQMVYSCDGENWDRLTSHSYSANSGGTYTFVETFTCDPVQIATFFPFTYEKMHNYVDTVSVSPWAVETILGSSVLGRDVDLLTITNPAIPNAGKRAIYIIGRQHSAETASSHMLEGLIDFLISGSPDAARMRNNFVWYFVPMVNPDGVYLGKSRETSEGNDPNRDWHQDNTGTAEVGLVRTHMEAINSAQGIDMFIDWHSQMNDARWYNFTYSPPGNTFFPILSSWTDIDSQDASGTSCAVNSCTARGFATLDLGVPMFGFEPTPHLATWTEASLNDQGELVAYAIDEYFPSGSGPLLVDYEFDNSSDSADLRANSTGQDWYESRSEAPAKLTLDTADIGGNTGNKAALKYSDPAESGYAYLTQEFGSPQSGSFSVSLDIYIDSLANDADRDRSGMIYIGDDNNAEGGPNNTSADRFVTLAFYDASPSTGLDTDLILKARECDATGHVSDYCITNNRDQSWNTTSAWTTITSGLSEDTWYTVRLVVDVANKTYDVYVDNILAGDDINAYEDYPSNSVTHISFSTGTATQGDFYVDKVQEAGEMQCFSSAGAYTFFTQSGR